MEAAAGRELGMAGGEGAGECSGVPQTAGRSRGRRVGGAHDDGVDGGEQLHSFQEREQLEKWNTAYSSSNTTHAER